MTNSIPTGGTTGGPGRHAAALARVLPAIGGMATVQRLAALSGSDFTSVMLEVARRRAARETPASVRRRYSRDRFTQPGRYPVALDAAGRGSPAGLPARRRRDADAGPGGAARHALGAGHGQPAQGADHDPGRARSRPTRPTRSPWRRRCAGSTTGPGLCKLAGPATGRPGAAVPGPGPRLISACSGWSRPVATRAITGSSGGRWPSTCGSRWPAGRGPAPARPARADAAVGGGGADRRRRHRRAERRPGQRGGRGDRPRPHPVQRPRLLP